MSQPPHTHHRHGRPKNESIRPYSITKHDADLCHAAGVSPAIFREPLDQPWKDRKSKLAAIRAELRRMAAWKDRLHYGSLGYRVDTPADIEHAKAMELAALQGKWLLEAEDQELEEMLVGPAIKDVFKLIRERSQQ